MYGRLVIIISAGPRTLSHQQIYSFHMYPGAKSRQEWLAHRQLLLPIIPSESRAEPDLLNQPNVYYGYTTHEPYITLS